MHSNRAPSPRTRNLPQYLSYAASDNLPPLGRRTVGANNSIAFAHTPCVARGREHPKSLRLAVEFVTPSH